MTKIERTTPIEELPQFLSIGEFSDHLGVGKSTVYQLIQKGELRVLRVGGRILIPREVLRPTEAA